MDTKSTFYNELHKYRQNIDSYNSFLFNEKRDEFIETIFVIKAWNKKNIWYIYIYTGVYFKNIFFFYINHLEQNICFLNAMNFFQYNKYIYHLY
jgi:hypothetical protein